METVISKDAAAGNLEEREEKDSERNILIHVFQKGLSKWWLFLLVGIVSGVVGFIYAARQRPVYESYLSFALDEGGSEGGMSAAIGLAAQFGLSLGGAKDVFTGDNIMEIMLSRRMVESVLLSVDTINNKPTTMAEDFLENETDDRQEAEAAIHFYPGESKNQFPYNKASLLYNVYLEFRQKHISVRRPNKRLNIFQLNVTSFNEKFSKVFTDRLIAETNRFYTEISSKKARETLEILEKRVPSMKGKLDAAIANKAAIQDANLNTAFAGAEVPMIKEMSNTQVFGAAYAEMFKNLEMARFQYLKSIPLMQVIDAADYPMRKIKQGKLKTAIIFSGITTFIFLMIFITINIVQDKSNLKKVPISKQEDP